MPSGFRDWFLLAITGDSFVPNTGIYDPTLTGEAIGYPGPYYNGGSSTACNLRDGLLTGCSVEVFNIQPTLTNGGTLEILQYKAPLNKTFAERGLSASIALVPVLARASMANLPYYQIRTLNSMMGNGKATVRAVWLPVDPTDQTYHSLTHPVSVGGSAHNDVMSTSWTGDYEAEDGFYILLTGAGTAGGACLRAKVTLIYQFHPLDTVASIVSQEAAGPGAMTRALQSQLLKAVPTVSFASLEESLNMVQSAMRTRSTDIDAVFASILDVPINARLTASGNGFGVVGTGGVNAKINTALKPKADRPDPPDPGPPHKYAPPLSFNSGETSPPLLRMK